MRLAGLRLQLTFTFALVSLLPVGSHGGAESGAPGAQANDVSTVNAAEKKSPLLEEAVTRFGIRDFDGALVACRKAVEQNPDLPPAEVFMADMFNAVDDPVSTRVWLERAAFQHQNDAKAFLVLGDMNLNERRVVEAHLLFSNGARLALAMKDEDPRKSALVSHARRGVAAVAELRGDWPTVQRHLDVLVKAAPKDAILVQGLGRALIFLGEPNEAFEHLKTAYDLDKKLLTPETLMGQLYEQMGNRANAARHMTSATAAHPNDLNTRLAVARWALDTGDLPLANEQAEAARAIDAESPAARLLSGTVALYTEDYPQAQKHYEAVVAKSPNHFAALNGLSLTLCEQDASEKKLRALEYAQANLRMLPRSTEAAATLGWVYYRLGRIKEADGMLSRLILASDLSPNAAYYIARTAVRQGRDEQAKQVLEAALKTKLHFAKRTDAEYLLEQLKK